MTGASHCPNIPTALHTHLPFLSHKIHSKSGASERKRKISAVILATPEAEQESWAETGLLPLPRLRRQHCSHTAASQKQTTAHKSRRSRPFPLDLGANLNTPNTDTSFSHNKVMLQPGIPYLSCITCRPRDLCPFAFPFRVRGPWRTPALLLPRCREPQPKQGRGECHSTICHSQF
jgi:hypothetical protein